MNKNLNYSYWDLKQYFSAFDLIIIGSGIVGLSTAISFKEKNKKARILVLEKGILAHGASTKNAGFACFGSPSELMDDLTKMPEKTVWETVKMRWEGLQLLQKRLGAKNIDLNFFGGYELFRNEDEFEKCRQQLDYLNNMTRQTIFLENTFTDVSKRVKNFNNIKGVLLNKYEGQIDTGLMMRQLTSLALKQDILILNGVMIKKIINGPMNQIVSEIGVFTSKRVVVATNGFARELLKIKNVLPARAQVLITKPIKGLKIKGTFHYQQGYYYFRNIDNRILFGGGRNLDFKTETTTSAELNKKIQANLNKLLREMILPGIPHEVEHRWTGIMGVGSEKKPIIEFVDKNILAAVRMGGMGVAIGSLVGKMAADKISDT